MRTAALLAGLLGALAPVLASAQTARGFAELRVGLFPGVSGKPWLLVERVRPTFTTDLSERVHLTATIEGALSEGRDANEALTDALLAAGLGSQLYASGWRKPTYANPSLHVNGAGDYLDVDRLFLDLYEKHFDLRIGRQALSWGVAKFFNPTDPFPEVLLTEPWRPRHGINAARITVPFSATSDLTAVAAIDDALVDFRGAARLRFDLDGTTLALVGAYRGQGNHALAGVDLQGNLGVAWWVEAAYLFGPTHHEEVSAGVSYSLPVLEELVFFGEYYRDGGGSTDVGSETDLATLAGAGASPLSPSAERSPFAPLVRGRDYALVGGNLTVTPELTCALTALQNLDDGSGVTIATVQWAVLGWLSVAGTAEVPYALAAGGGEFHPDDAALHPNIPTGVDGKSVPVDLTGLVPAATLTFWTRASF